MLTAETRTAKAFLRKWRILGNPPFYGIMGVLLLCLLLGAVIFLVVRIHESQLPATFRTYWYYDPVVGFLLVVLFVLFQRPRLLALSRWRPKWTDIAIGIVLGIAVPLILWLSVQDPIRSLGFRPMLGTSLIPVICLSPVLEELLFRATFLRSFESYFPKVVAILLSAMLVSLIHPHFLVALPLELISSLLYVVLGHSLPASITAHIANNAAVLFLSTGALEKWHTYVWSL
jgi:membrane protease YdiL (CAAX protease family)